MVYHVLTSMNLFPNAWSTLEGVIIRAILAAITGFLFCLTFGPWIIHKLTEMQIKQYIQEDGPESHLEKANTPTMGGIIIILSLFFTTIMWANLQNPMILISLFATGSFGIIGFIDDYVMQIKKRNKGLGVKEKLILQVLASAIVTLLICLLPTFDTKLTLPFSKKLFFDLNWMYIPFSIFVLVGTSNSVNLNDGLDGMAIGNLTIAKVTYMLIAFITGHSKLAAYVGISYVAGSSDLAVYSGAFIGSGLGFLWFNSYPAQIFMGDIGSLSIGASLATVGIIIQHEMLLILIGGVFVIESISVMLQVVFFKITRGKRLFKMAPIHHHFELTGLSEPTIVLRFWIISIMLSLFSITSIMK